MSKYTVVYVGVGHFYNIVAVFEGYHKELTSLSRTVHIEAINLNDAYTKAAKILAEKAQRKAEEV